MNSIKVQSECLKIVKFSSDMVESVYHNSHDENTKRFIPDEYFETIEEAREVVEYFMSNYGNKDVPQVYPIVLNSGENIGYIQVVPIDDGKYEIGYHIAEKYTGKGYATEALNEFLPYIMNELKIQSIYGICNADNIGSRKVLEKCGFELLSEDITNADNVKICEYIYTI
jgi:RimJ/RimL family protein N-acetyltransferase